MKKTQTSIFLSLLVGYLFLPVLTIRAKDVKTNPRIVNIINFIRQTEPRIESYTDQVLYQTTENQSRKMRELGLIGTFLLQYDALLSDNYQRLMKEEIDRGCEVGAWWEITQPHVEAAGMEWRGRYPWDWHTNVGFSVGYTPAEREKLVDVYMEKFKQIFGQYPKCVGSWFIDAHSLAYMYDKYGIEASCNCRDQVGTDGYTLWGGYWEGGFYPSRKNAYMPAQTFKGQIGVPVFRMLGSDPIYQYDAGVGGAVQSVATLEPVYGNGGGSPTWVDWFFRSFTEDPYLGFGYVQTGQENSFVWGPMERGFVYQMEKIKELANQGKLEVQTLLQTGRWFKKRYPLTPATSISTLVDHSGNDKKTVWFNSRYYRTNLLWEDGHMKFRDIHLFAEDVESDYLRVPTTSTQCFYFTLPLVDGCLWSTQEERAALRLYEKNGGMLYELEGTGNPIVGSKGKDMLVEWPTKSGKVVLLMNEKCMDISLDGKNVNWLMRLETAGNTELPFKAVEKKKLKANQKGFDYAVKLQRGWFEKRDNKVVFDLFPEKGKIRLLLNTAANA